MISTPKVVLFAALICITFTDDALGIKCHRCSDCANNPPVVSPCSSEVTDGVEAAGCLTGKNGDKTEKACYYPTKLYQCMEGAGYPADDPGKDRCVKNEVTMDGLNNCTGETMGTGEGFLRFNFCVCKGDMCNTDSSQVINALGAGKHLETQLGIVIAAVLVQLAVFN